MPVYNSEDFIKESIESILGQSLQDIELIISDNASTDATIDICREFATKDRRVRYYANPANIGVTENYNRVFHYAQGPYFKWASSNDVCAPDFIRRCVDVLDRRPDAVLCYPKTRLFDTEITCGEDYEDNLDLQEEDPASRFEHLIDRIYSRLDNIMNGVIRTEVLQRTPLHKPFTGSDLSLMAELALFGKIIEVPERLYFRRINAKAHSHKQSKTQMQESYWPLHKKALMFQTWKLFLGYFTAVLRSQLTYGDKNKLYLKLTKRLVWAREQLVRELASAVSV